MNVVLLQAASGPSVKGPVVRIPPGNYSVEKSGAFDSCDMLLNDTRLPLNSRVILSNHSQIKLLAENAKNLTVRFIRM